MKITDFLNARIDEDEAIAREALSPDLFEDEKHYYPTLGPQRDDWGLWTFHMPVARVLRECEAKRMLLGEAQRWSATGNDTLKLCAERVLRMMASAYADHGDHDPAWGLP